MEKGKRNSLQRKQTMEKRRRIWGMAGWKGWGLGILKSRDLGRAFPVTFPALGTLRTVSSHGHACVVSLLICQQPGEWKAIWDQLDLPFLSLLCIHRGPSVGASPFPVLASTFNSSSDYFYLEASRWTGQCLFFLFLCDRTDDCTCKEIQSILLCWCCFKKPFWAPLLLVLETRLLSLLDSSCELWI